MTTTKFYSSSLNTRDFDHEIHAQNEARLHREYNPAMKNKKPPADRFPCAVEGAYAPRTSRQERRGVLESSSRNTRDFDHEIHAQMKLAFIVSTFPR